MKVRIWVTVAALGVLSGVAGPAKAVTGGPSTSAGRPAASAPICGLSLGELSAGMLSLHWVKATSPVTRVAQGGFGFGLNDPQVAAFAQVSRWHGGTYLSSLDVWLTLRSGATERTTVWEEPRDSSEPATGPDRGFTQTQKVVISSHRGPRDPGFPGPVHAPDRRGDAIYSIESGGVLVRRSSTARTSVNGALRGFADIRAMTLISRAPTYDKILANTRDGRLLTITVPATKAFRPKRTTLRGSGWAGIDRLIANSCGNGTVVMGFDGRTKSAWLYRLGFAKGASTPITPLGQVPGRWIGVRTAPVVNVEGPMGGDRILGG